MYKIYNAVGPESKRCSAHWNESFDVRIIQHLLNEKLASENIKSNRFKMPLNVDGRCGSRTVAAIDYFQIKKVQLFQHDSIVHPKGPTFTKLVEGVPESQLKAIWNDAAAHSVAVNSAHAKQISRIANNAGHKIKTPSVWVSGSNKNALPTVEPIPDTEFVDFNALKLEQIEAILQKHNPNLLVSKAHYSILDTAKKYQLNPKVLLATLWQEQNWDKANTGKSMGIDAGTGGQPVSMRLDASIDAAGQKYTRFFAEGKQRLKQLKINYDPTGNERKAALGKRLQQWKLGHAQEDADLAAGFPFTPRTASEYAKLRYTPFTYFAPQNSRPYDTWVTMFRSFQ